MNKIAALVNDIATGLREFLLGIGWFLKNPRMMLLLFVPMFLSLVLFIVMGVAVFDRGALVFRYLFPFAEPTVWWGWLLYYSAYGLFYVLSLSLVFEVTLMANTIIAAPIYEYISIVIEREWRKEHHLPGAVSELSLWQSVKLVGEEIKKALFILAVTLFIMAIPGVNLLSLLTTAVLLGWNFYDYPLARQGLRFRQRLQLVSLDMGRLLGLGLWLMIPVVQVFLMPFAIVGGTRLALMRQQLSSASASGSGSASASGSGNS